MPVVAPLRAGILAGLLSILIPASAGAAQRIGPDLGALAPVARCDQASCNLVQLAGAAGAASPADGVIVRYRVKHGQASSALDQVRLLVLERRGDQLALVRQSDAAYLGTSPATEEFAVRLPIAAGQLIGLRVESTFTPAVPVLTTSGPGEVTGRYAGTQATGAAAPYAGAEGVTLLLNADLEPSGGSGQPGGSGGSGGSGKPGGSGGSGGGTSPTTPAPPADSAVSCPPSAAASAATGRSRAVAPVARRLLRVAPGARVAARWRTTIVDATDNYNEVDAAYDGRGRLHVAGRGALRKAVVYRGPSGQRVIESTNDDGSVAVAVPRTGPLVGYGMDHASSANGRLIYCDVLKLAAGPGFAPQVFLAQPENETGFFFADLAADPRGATTHAVYELGRARPRLFHHVVGGARQELALTGGVLRQARIEASGPTVAIAARTDGALAVYVRRGGGPFRRTVVARGTGAFDLALGRDGRPRLAFSDRRGRLALFTGRRVVRTGAPVSAVGLATGPGGRMEVAIAPTAQACDRSSIWHCRRGGLYLLSVNARATRARTSVVQSTTGFAPVRIAVATHGAKVAVVYGDPAHSRRLTVRSR